MDDKERSIPPPNNDSDQLKEQQMEDVLEIEIAMKDEEGEMLKGQ